MFSRTSVFLERENNCFQNIQHATKTNGMIIKQNCKHKMCINIRKSTGLPIVKHRIFGFDKTIHYISISAHKICLYAAHNVYII